MPKKVIIIGGVAGGASTAARLRRLDETAEIIMFEKGKYISFANCGLPYYIGDVINEREMLIVQTPENMKKRFNIDVRVSCEVTKINKHNKTVEVFDSLNDKRYTESYDYLVISTGAVPFKPKIDGIDSEMVFSLRDIPDTDRIKDFITTRRPKRALIVGAGFIGLEMAENLSDMGLEVTLVELSDHVIGALDYDIAAFVHQHLKSKGVKLFLNNAVTGFRSFGTVINAELSRGLTLETDMVIMGIGVRPEIKLAAEAGIKLGKKGGISVNEHMQTYDPNIFAVGDVAEVRDFIYEGTVPHDLSERANEHVSVLIPLAGPANKQGRIAADNICGRSSKYKGTQGTSIVKVFDLTVAVTGNNEKQLIKNEIDFEKSITHSPSHAGYYPGAKTMTIKMLFAKADGRIHGAQIVGIDGVDKRIDVIATAIRARMTVYDLEELELAYAPPFSSAKDPVNIAGFVASNILKGDVSIFHWDEVQNLDRSRVHIVDVRTKAEYSLGTIDGAKNIPVDEIRDRLAELKDGKDVYILCQAGLRGYIATRILIQKGFKNVRNLSGGYLVYHMSMQDVLTNNVENEAKAFAVGDNADNSEATECGKPKIYKLDVCDLPFSEIMSKVNSYYQKLESGDLFDVISTLPELRKSIQDWCDSTGCKLISVFDGNQQLRITIRK